MNALGRRIAKLIETQGPLSIAQFMTIALHDSEGGYYATRDPFGADGDFVTAPDISQIFGELIGLWCVQIWRDQGKPQNSLLVELGPGRGTLMADALRAAKLAPEFLDTVEVLLVEASPVLRAQQQARLTNCGARIAWTERFDYADRPLFVIANEFFDALPVRQYVFAERGWCERVVAVDDKGELMFALAPFPTPLPIGEAEHGAVYEMASAAQALTHDIADTIARYGGGALIVDYGYAESGFGETLQALHRHRFDDVLKSPGQSDISAHVDFARLTDAARRSGAQIHGPIGQGAFLEKLGIAARAEKLSRLNRDEAPSIAAAMDRLINPAHMGTLFKALAIVPPNTSPPPGF